MDFKDRCEMGFCLTADMRHFIPRQLSAWNMACFSLAPWSPEHTETWAYAECQCQAPFWFTPPTRWWGRDLPLMHPETVKQSWAKYYLFFLLEWNNAICGNMDGPRNDHSKSSKSDKDKYHMTPLIRGILNMTRVNLSTKQKRAHRHRTQTCSCQGVGS